MTYATSGLIQASDYNGFIADNPDNVNVIWAAGAGDKGYGQPAINTVNPSELILSSTQVQLVQNITSSANHQGTTIGAWLDASPTNGDLIFVETNLSSNITSITTGRLNAIAQSSTTTTTGTNSIAWLNDLTFSFSVVFAGNDQARYFFNAGGQIAFNFSHPGGSTINTKLSTVCGNAGTVYASSPTSGIATIVGTPFNGVTKIGGGDPANQYINTNYGFHAFTSTLTQIFQQTGTGGYYYYGGSILLRIYAASNGAGTLTFNCFVDNLSGSTVSGGTVANMILRPPSTTYLTNTWGTPATAVSITRT